MRRGTGAVWVVAQTSPSMIVYGAVLELVKVLETTPYVLSEPRDGAVAAYVVIGPMRATRDVIANTHTETLLRFFILFTRYETIN